MLFRFLSKIIWNLINLNNCSLRISLIWVSGRYYISVFNEKGWCLVGSPIKICLVVVYTRNQKRLAVSGNLNRHHRALRDGITKTARRVINITRADKVTHQIFLQI
jgi:hypothetical protein